MLDVGEGVLFFNDGQQPNARVPHVRGVNIGRRDQTIASIVKADCGGTNVVSCGESCSLRVGEKTGTVTACKFVEGFQEDWQGGQHNRGIDPEKRLNYWIGSGVINQLTKGFQGKQGFSPGVV